MWPCSVPHVRSSLGVIGAAFRRQRDELLIPVRQLPRFRRLQPIVVLHVGAHEGEELEDYAHPG